MFYPQNMKQSRKQTAGVLPHPIEGLPCRLNGKPVDRIYDRFASLLAASGCLPPVFLMS